MGRDGIRQDLDGFRALHGYEPQSFLIGYDQSPDPDIFPPGKVPSAIWINARNPLPKITTALAARIFTTGAPGGDITTWSQLGDKGEWAHREIHIYLPAKRDSAFLFIDHNRLGNRPWSPRVEWVDASTDVMAAVAQDPFGIGIVGYWPPDPGWDRQAELGTPGQAPRRWPRTRTPTTPTPSPAILTPSPAPSASTSTPPPASPSNPGWPSTCASPSPAKARTSSNPSPPTTATSP